MPYPTDMSAVRQTFAGKGAWSAILSAAWFFSLATSAPLQEKLKDSHFKIAFECYVNDNWEIFVRNADGSEPVNLTRTPQEHEHYPQVSPDGARICFCVDRGEGREAVRGLYVMEVDGRNR